MSIDSSNKDSSQSGQDTSSEPGEVAGSPVDRLLSELQGDEASDEGHRFTLQRDVAMRKLQESLVADPEHYLLFLVRGAVRRRSTRVDVTLDSQSVTLAFDGVPFGQDDLENLYDSVLSYGTEENAARPGLKEVALGLTVCRKLPFESFTLISGSGGEAVRLLARPQTADLISLVDSSADSKVEGTRIDIALPASRLSLARNFTVESQKRLLEKACRFSRIPVFVGGECVVPPADSALGVAQGAFSTDRIEVRFGFLPEVGHEPELVFLRDGIQVASRRLFLSSDPALSASGPVDPSDPLAEMHLTAGQWGFWAVVDADELAMDLSQSKIVEDESLEQLLQRAREAFTASCASPETASLVRSRLEKLTTDLFLPFLQRYKEHRDWFYFTATFLVFLVFISGIGSCVLSRCDYVSSRIPWYFAGGWLLLNIVLSIFNHFLVTRAGMGWFEEILPKGTPLRAAAFVLADKRADLPVYRQFNADLSSKLSTH